MKYLFKNISILDQNSDELFKQCVVIDDGIIAYVGDTTIQHMRYDRIIDGTNKLMIPALYNTHTHLPMSILKGYGEDLPLDKWLNERIFPAEDKLTNEAVYYASMLSIAELLRNGVVSSSDMYSFCDEIARAIEESGAKCNIGRGVVSFVPNQDESLNSRYLEAVDLHKRYHNTANSRIKIDMSIHAEYTSFPETVRIVSEYAKENDLGMHIHLSETRKEHEACIAKHGKTPTEYFNDLGVFDGRTVAAHCVHLSDGDIDILADKGVYVSLCPTSNLKLASGVARADYMSKRGVALTVGTDGSASNNNLDVLKELQLTSLLQKNLCSAPEAMPANAMLSLATLQSARAQGREKCGTVSEGMCADVVLLDISDIAAYPMYGLASSLMFSLNSRNVCLTMADGKILYENGEYTTIDIEKVKNKVQEISEKLYSGIPRS